MFVHVRPVFASSFALAEARGVDLSVGSSCSVSASRLLSNFLCASKEITSQFFLSGMMWQEMMVGWAKMLGISNS
jgi:hypothetical protein